jgi:hypothetical protein
MGPFRHLIVLVVIAVVFRWLRTSSLTERAKLEAGRKIFPPTRAIRILVLVLAAAFTGLFLWSWFAARKPDEWWVPCLFLGFLALDLCIYPPVLYIEVEGLGSCSWWRPEKKIIRWEDVASLHYNTGSKQFVVRAKDGRKTAHGGFNVEQGQFVHDIHERTRLPMKLTRLGTWKSETFEVPYEESREEDSSEEENQDEEEDIVRA